VADFEINPMWNRVATGVAAAMVLWAVVVTVVTGEVIPPIVLFTALFVIFWGLTVWRPGKVTYVLFGVLGLLTVLLNLPFIAEDLVHPESAFGFNTTTLPIIASLLAVAVGVAALRGLSGGLASRLIMIGGALFVVGLAVSIVAALGLEDDTSEAGDLRVVAEKVEFAPTTVSGAAGTIGIFVDNEDPVRHTLTIDALDVDLELPAGTTRRIEVSAPAGTYEFHCAVPGHESMKGTLTLAG
jgi:plastocyanin